MGRCDNTDRWGTYVIKYGLAVSEFMENFRKYIHNDDKRGVFGSRAEFFPTTQYRGVRPASKNNGYLGAFVRKTKGRCAGISRSDTAVPRYVKALTRHTLYGMHMLQDKDIFRW